MHGLKYSRIQLKEIESFFAFFILETSRFLSPEKLSQSYFFYFSLVKFCHLLIILLYLEHMINYSELIKKIEERHEKTDNFFNPTAYGIGTLSEQLCENLLQNI